MVKGIVIGAVGVVLAAVAVAWIAISMGYVPSNADASPSRLERFIATKALRADIERQAPAGPNPVAATDANVIEGIHLYAANCAVCHGAKGTEPSHIAQGLYQKPPQFGAPRRQMPGSGHPKAGGNREGGAYWKIFHGIRMTGMPSFGGTLSQDQIWKIALFLSRKDSLSPAAEKAWSAVKN